MNCHKQAVHMKNRQGVNQHIATLPAPVIFQHLRVAEKIGMTEHRAFAATRCTAGVNDGCQVVRFCIYRRVHIAVVRGALEQTATALIVQRHHVTRACLKRDFADPAEIGRCTHHQRRFCISHEIRNFSLLVSRIQRQKHVTAAQTREIKHQHFDRFLSLHSNARRRWQLQALYPIGQHSAAAFQVAPAVAQTMVGFNRRLRQVRRKALAQADVKVVVHINQLNDVWTRP